MRKSIFFSLLCLIAIVAVACGGGNNATGNGTGGGDAACGGGNGGGAADAFALYKKEGRKWKHKSVNKIEGQPDMVSFTEYEVTEVTDDHAKYKMTMLDKDGKPMAGMEPTVTEVKFETPKATDTGGEAAAEPTKETIKVEAGEFECYVNDTAGTKSWSSVKYPGLLVKMEGATNTMELIEFTE